MKLILLCVISTFIFYIKQKTPRARCGKRCDCGVRQRSYKIVFKPFYHRVAPPYRRTDRAARRRRTLSQAFVESGEAVGHGGWRFVV